MGRVTREKFFRNHRLRLSLTKGKFALDNPSVYTYHTGAYANGLTSNARKIHVGNRVN